MHAPAYMITKHLTQVVFGSAVFFSLLSSGLTFMLNDFFLILVVLSILFNIWSLLKSERDGFVKSSQFRRAYEPARHFNIAQVLIVMALLMLQFGLGAYVLLT